MSWKLTFSHNARRSLRRLPAEQRQRLDAVCAEMEGNPLSGDIVVLKDYPIGYRGRVGVDRILFDMNQTARMVQIQQIRRRTSTTYRRRR